MGVQGEEDSHLAWGRWCNRGACRGCFSYKYQCAGPEILTINKAKHLVPNFFKTAIFI